MYDLVFSYQHNRVSHFAQADHILLPAFSSVVAHVEDSLAIFFKVAKQFRSTRYNGATS